jgi:predicted Zn-dependent protease
LASNPDNIVMKLLKAGIYATTDRLAEAEATYRGVLAESPQAVNAWQALYAMMNRQGRAEEATAVLREGLAANPDAGNLQWALAGELEKSGDIDGAIAIYQSLYDRNSDSVIVANNLASLLSTYKTDDESLERAWSIARRLRGMDNPALQDTYGWIALRKGQTEEALQHLEPAAAGLPEDPIVQYHLAVAYEKAGRIPEAIERFRQAVDLAGPADTRQQFQTAREEIVRLSELPAAQPSK